MYAEKREGFRRGGKENEFERRKSIETYRKYKNWPNMSLFIVRVFSAYYLLYFSLFYYFIKRNSILLSIK